MSLDMCARVHVCVCVCIFIVPVAPQRSRKWQLSHKSQVLMISWPLQGRLYITDLTNLSLLFHEEMFPSFVYILFWTDSCSF